MNFVKDSVNQQPIVDTVFTIVAKAKEAKEKYGADQVVDATIGSLYNEEGQLVALDSVFNSLKNLDNKVLAKYAASFTGNPTFRQKAYDWVLDGNSRLEHEVVATPGGTVAPLPGDDLHLHPLHERGRALRSHVAHARRQGNDQCGTGRHRGPAWGGHAGRSLHRLSAGRGV